MHNEVGTCTEIIPKNSSDVPVSAKDNFLCTNVNISSLKLVLDRLADLQANCVREEQAVGCDCKLC